MRILTGAAMAGAGLVICVTLVSRWFVAHRGLALGLMLSGTSLGNAFVPQLATWLIDVNGWRASFYVLACLPLALLPIIGLPSRNGPSGWALRPTAGRRWSRLAK